MEVENSKSNLSVMEKNIISIETSVTDKQWAVAYAFFNLKWLCPLEIAASLTANTLQELEREQEDLESRVSSHITAGAGDWRPAQYQNRKGS